MLAAKLTVTEKKYDKLRFSYFLNLRENDRRLWQADYDAYQVILDTHQPCRFYEFLNGIQLLPGIQQGNVGK